MSVITFAVPTRMKLLTSPVATMSPTTSAPMRENPSSVALARAWALHPEVLFLDEPTANLDPGATREIENVIKAFDASGTKIVMSTHNLGQARRLGDEVLFIHQGRLVERAPVETFFKQPASSEAAAFIKGELLWA